MAIVVQQPPDVHAAFNPVILILEASSQNELDEGIQCSLISDGKTQDIFSEFFNNKARFELSEILKYLFIDKEVFLSQYCFHDRRLSFDYSVITPSNVSNHTAVNAVVQIGRNPNMSDWGSRFLTNFPAIKKYDGYPLSVSCLNIQGGIFVGFDGENINQNPIQNHHFSVNIPDGVESISMVENTIF